MRANKENLQRDSQQFPQKAGVQSNLNSTGDVSVCGTASICDRVQIVCRLQHW